jgi:hypothetical protein
LAGAFFGMEGFALAPTLFAGALFFAVRFGGFVFTAFRFAGLTLARLTRVGLTLLVGFFDFLEGFFLAAMAAV